MVSWSRGSGAGVAARGQRLSVLLRSWMRGKFFSVFSGNYFQLKLYNACIYRTPLSYSATPCPSCPTLLALLPLPPARCSAFFRLAWLKINKHFQRVCDAVFVPLAGSPSPLSPSLFLPLSNSCSRLLLLSLSLSLLGQLSEACCSIY